MEELLMKLRAFSRWLELEDNIPFWEEQQTELRARIAEMEWNRRQKELELQSLQDPNFFQRIFGTAGEKRERLGKQIQEIKTARMAAQWDLESLTKKIASGSQELASFAGSRAAYEDAKANTFLTPAQEGRLMMEEISAFAPAALRTTERILENLENASFRMEKSQDNQEVESLKNAGAAAEHLLFILSLLPEGVATVSSYLRAPYDFISGEKQFERLNQAQEQIRNVRNQLRLLLGE